MMDPALAIKLETALYADEFMGDFDKLLRLAGCTLRLVWTGERNRDDVRLLLVTGGVGIPLAAYRPEWIGMRWVAGHPKADDFRDRLKKLLELHRAEIGLGIACVQKIARCNIGFPHAPRLKDTDPPLSRRVLYTRKCKPGHLCSGEYAPQEVA